VILMKFAIILKTWWQRSSYIRHVEWRQRGK